MRVRPMGRALLLSLLSVAAPAPAAAGGWVVVPFGYETPVDHDTAWTLLDTDSVRPLSSGRFAIATMFMRASDELPGAAYQEVVDCAAKKTLYLVSEDLDPSGRKTRTRRGSMAQPVDQISWTFGSRDTGHIAEYVCSRATGAPKLANRPMFRGSFPYKEARAELVRLARTGEHRRLAQLLARNGGLTLTSGGRTAPVSAARIEGCRLRFDIVNAAPVTLDLRRSFEVDDKSLYSSQDPGLRLGPKGAIVLRAPREGYSDISLLNGLSSALRWSAYYC